MPKQILLADDSITIQKVIALTFAGEDYKITAVNNGVDALAKARELRPDIILADVVMPQKNGYEVSAEIKNDPELKNIPVLLLAGTFEPFDEDEAKKVGADAYIIKPFESQVLIQKVKDLIARRAAVSATTQPQPTAVPPVVRPAAVPPKAQPLTPAVPVIPMALTQPVAAPIPPVAPVVPMASEPPAEEDFWGTMMEEVDGKASEVKPSPVQPPEAAVSGADVWDMGELEEAVPVAAKGEEELWESFAFEEAEVKEEIMEAPLLEEAVSVEEVPLEVDEEPLEFAAPQETTGEDLVFGTEEVAEAEIDEAQEVLEEEHIELVEEAAGIVPLYEQTFEPEAMSREVPLAPPSEPPPLPISAALTEDQLRVALSKVSREVIEKIVWEVVPDLAEMLIKEEIKRLQKKQ
ncbi:MAG: Response regulatory protein [Deltaproteobacteria bacterium]|nr:Response regulatory protein [Deltaproteobacteria bacterium]